MVCALEPGKKIHAWALVRKNLVSSFHRIIPGHISLGGNFTCHKGKPIYGMKFDDENFILKHRSWQFGPWQMLDSTPTGPSFPSVPSRLNGWRPRSFLGSGTARPSKRQWCSIQWVCGQDNDFWLWTINRSFLLLENTRASSLNMLRMSSGPYVLSTVLSSIVSCPPLHLVGLQLFMNF